MAALVQEAEAVEELEGREGPEGPEDRAVAGPAGEWDLSCRLAARRSGLDRRRRRTEAPKADPGEQPAREGRRRGPLKKLEDVSNNVSLKKSLRYHLVEVCDWSRLLHRLLVRVCQPGRE